MTSRRRGSSDRNNRNNSNKEGGTSRPTLSDEEFERILEEKENEERHLKNQQSSRRSNHNSHHHSNHHHHNSNSHYPNRRSGGQGGNGRTSSRYDRRSRSLPSTDEDRDADVDHEIRMVEQRLKAQRLLQKSLDQVQSLDTESYAALGASSSRHRQQQQQRLLGISAAQKKTAFVNPHFKPKVDLPVMNVLPLNVAGQPLSAGGSATNHVVPIAVQGGPTTILLPAGPVMLPQRPVQSKVILSPLVTSPTLQTKALIASPYSTNISTSSLGILSPSLENNEGMVGIRPFSFLISILFKRSPPSELLKLEDEYQSKLNDICL